MKINKIRSALARVIFFLIAIPAIIWSFILLIVFIIANLALRVIKKRELSDHEIDVLVNIACFGFDKANKIVSYMEPDKYDN